MLCSLPQKNGRNGRPNSDGSPAISSKRLGCPRHKSLLQCSALPCPRRPSQTTHRHHTAIHKARTRPSLRGPIAITPLRRLWAQLPTSGLRNQGSEVSILIPPSLLQSDRQLRQPSHMVHPSHQQRRLAIKATSFRDCLYQVWQFLILSPHRVRSPWLFRTISNNMVFLSCLHCLH